MCVLISLSTLSQDACPRDRHIPRTRVKLVVASCGIHARHGGLGRLLYGAISLWCTDNRAVDSVALFAQEIVFPVEYAGRGLRGSLSLVGMELVHLATDTECGPSILLYNANELVKGFVERSDVRLDADASKLEERILKRTRSLMR